VVRLLLDVGRCGIPDVHSKMTLNSCEVTVMRTRLLRGVLARAAAPALAMVFLAAAARDLSAQTPFVPYFGKNQIHYDNFE